MYLVYILESLKFDRYYTGHTSDIEGRLKKHNSGQVKSTKPYAPWKLIHNEEFELKSEAFKREMEIKKYKSGIKFKKLIGKFKLV